MAIEDGALTQQGGHKTKGTEEATLTEGATGHTIPTKDLTLSHKTISSITTIRTITSKITTRTKTITHLQTTMTTIEVDTVEVTEVTTRVLEEATLITAATKLTIKAGVVTPELTMDQEQIKVKPMDHTTLTTIQMKASVGSAGMPMLKASAPTE